MGKGFGLFLWLDKHDCKKRMIQVCKLSTVFLKFLLNVFDQTYSSFAQQRHSPLAHDMRSRHWRYSATCSRQFPLPFLIHLSSRTAPPPPSPPPPPPGPEGRWPQAAKNWKVIKTDEGKNGSFLQVENSCAPHLQCAQPLFLPVSILRVSLQTDCPVRKPAVTFLRYPKPSATCPEGWYS